MKNVRNIAIIAHVDHGKTTLIDGLMSQSNTVASHRQLEERAMDSNDLERERGITIYAKCTGIDWNDHRINIIDTPGHADFGGEVERVLKMVDCVLLVVDAFEGPMPQTKFVLRKALGLGHFPVVVINKIDRPNARPDEVLNMVFDLFVDLEASDEQLDFAVVYASGIQGYAMKELGDEPVDLKPLFDTIIEHVDPPSGDPEAPLQMQIATLNYDAYLGRVAIGRIFNGRVTEGDRVAVCRNDGTKDSARVTKLWGFKGLERVLRTEASAGDIVALTGFDAILPGDTITDLENPVPMPAIEVDEPTLSMIFMINNSPFAGKEGKFVTSRQIKERLDKELEFNVSLRVNLTERAEAFEVSGRGELSLTILLETMRREGYEIQVSQPRVIFREDENGKKLEPIEEVVIETDSDYAGTVINKLQQRRGDLLGVHVNHDNTQRLTFRVPSRGMLGYRSEFLTDTRGTGVMYSNFDGYEPHRGDLPFKRNGALIVLENGDTTGYSLFSLQERGQLFVGPGEEVYGGQVVGLHARDNDLVVNPCKKKQLTNMRSSGADDALILTPPRKLNLEQAIEFIQHDEYVEITPKSIRIRKAELEHNRRKTK
ncbi:translational GTPase TypA [Microvenator marinus]|jgi:GTP-binding protein|uniref:Large ribosomal subunit assembly factor BipA n=1 Tax=Microvenator marinus TaxID=2600177 RepID=A0A5B8XPF5_9DELT|nr:translational GTPase TypA [Microvenator marinus]QED27365.1 translational GTPase TypA [Microvenator marinus]